MNAEDTFVPIILFLSIAAVIIVAISTRHRERLAMLEKGVSSDLIAAMKARSPYVAHPLVSLKWGILFVMGGLAILLGNYLHQVYLMEEGAIIGLLALFVGIGLVIFYLIAAKRTSQSV